MIRKAVKCTRTDEPKATIFFSEPAGQPVIAHRIAYLSTVLSPTCTNSCHWGFPGLCWFWSASLSRSVAGRITAKEAQMSFLLAWGEEGYF